MSRYHIRLHIVKATTLHAGDIFTSDPYVKVHKHKEQVYKTNVIKNTLDPVWNEHVEFDVDHDERLQIEVWDFDSITHDDFLGEAFFNVGKWGEHDLKLQQRNGEPSKVSGSVHIKIECLKDNHPPQQAQIHQNPVPTPQVHQEPIHPPHQEPVHPPHQEPVHPPHQEPVHPPHQEPVHPPHQEPVHPPHQEPVHPPHQEPVHPPHQEPVHPPHQEPVHPPHHEPAPVHQETQSQDSHSTKGKYVIYYHKDGFFSRGHESYEKAKHGAKEFDGKYAFVITKGKKYFIKTYGESEWVQKIIVHFGLKGLYSLHLHRNGVECAGNFANFEEAKKISEEFNNKLAFIIIKRDTVVFEFGEEKWIKTIKNYCKVLGKYRLYAHHDKKVNDHGDFPTLEAAKHKAEQWHGKTAFIITKGKYSKELIHAYGEYKWVRQCQHYAGAFGKFTVICHRDNEVKYAGDFATLENAQAKASEWGGKFAHIIVKGGKHRKLVHSFGDDEWVKQCVNFVNGEYGLYYYNKDCFYAGNFDSFEEAKKKADSWGGKLAFIIVKGRKRKVVHQFGGAEWVNYCKQFCGVCDEK